MLIPQINNIVLRRGFAYTLTLFYQTDARAPISLVDSSAVLSLKANANQPVADLVLSSAGGEIILGGVTGRIDITFTSQATATLLADAYVFDMNLTQLVPSEYTFPFIGGSLTVQNGVMRIGPNDEENADLVAID